MKTYLNILFLFISIILISCDPGLKGDLKIYNETNQILTAKYFEYAKSDTVLKEIQPNTSETIRILDGLGNKKEFDCCPCVLEILIVFSPTGKIKKDPTNSDNWEIPNKSKLKKFGKIKSGCHRRHPLFYCAGEKLFSFFRQRVFHTLIMRLFF